MNIQVFKNNQQIGIAELEDIVQSAAGIIAAGDNDFAMECALPEDQPTYHALGLLQEELTLAQIVNEDLVKTLLADGKSIELDEYKITAA